MAKKPYPASFWIFSFSIPTPSNHSSCGQATSLTKCLFDSTIFWMSSQNHEECNSRIAFQVSTVASQSWWGFRSEECAHSAYLRAFYYKVFHLAKSNPLAPGTWAEPRLEAIWAHSVPELTGFTVDSIPQSWTARKLFESEGAHKDSKYICIIQKYSEFCHLGYTWSMCFLCFRHHNWKMGLQTPGIK